MIRPSASNCRKRTITVGLSGPDGTVVLALDCKDAEIGPHSIEKWEHQRH